MARPAIQLYTLRDVDRPVAELLELVADAGFEGVEFAYRVSGADTGAVAETLSATGLEPVGAHVHADVLEADFETAVDRYERVGVENVVVPGLDEEYFTSRVGIEDAADRLGALESRLDARELALHYHTHRREFVEFDGATAFEAFVDATTCGIELDLGLALSAGEDPVARLRSLGGRSRLVHLKDVDLGAGEFVPVGEGDLDLNGIADAVAATGLEWLVYEYEGPDPVTTLERSADRTADLC